MRELLVTILAAGLAAGGASAAQSLRDIERVESGLFAMAVADKIRRECGDIHARFFKARGALHALYDLARSHGYSDAQIEAYVESDAERARMRARRDGYLAERGVVESDPETYCAAGRAEIRASTRIGALLRD